VLHNYSIVLQVTTLVNVIQVVFSLPRLNKWEPTMAKKSPWHSVKASVHHNDTNCNTGNNIESENIRQGTGGKPLCQECKNLG